MIQPIRKIEEKIFKLLMQAATAVVFASLVVILAVIFWKGFPALSWEMVSQTPKGGFYLGKEGGILNAITGSFL